MENVVSLLLGIIIGSAITYYFLQKSQQRKTIREYESQIQVLKEQHHQELKEAKNRSIDGSHAVIKEKDLSQKAYSIKDIKKTYSRAYEPWTKNEDEQLRQRYTQGATINDLVGEFQRQPGGIRSRLKKLGLLQ